MSGFEPASLVRKVLLMIVFWGIVLSSCSSESSDGPRLRITNNGSVPIHNLVVLFPEDRILFGDVPAGTTTEYQDVPNGVYSYAAYQFEVDGQVVTQPVLDWVGEIPMNGTRFTYVLDFDPDRENTGDQIQLIEVTNDN